MQHFLAFRYGDIIFIFLLFCKIVKHMMAMQLNMGRAKRKCTFKHFKSFWAMYHTVLCSPFIRSVVSNGSVSGWWKALIGLRG